MENNPAVIEINGQVVRIQAPHETDRAELLILLHGWTGDENAMWVFTRHLPKRFWILAPRALYPTPQGGYSWTSTSSGVDASITDFQDGVQAILAMVSAWQPASPLDCRTFSVIGFSQGTALAYSLALLHPDRVRRLAGLAGFLPKNVGEIVSRMPLAGKAFFVTHGRRDERIPIETARRAVSLLEQAGASVEYCEADIGHKLNLDCLKRVETYFTSPAP